MLPTHLVRQTAGHRLHPSLSQLRESRARKARVPAPLGSPPEGCALRDSALSRVALRALRVLVAGFAALLLLSEPAAAQSCDLGTGDYCSPRVNCRPGFECILDPLDFTGGQRGTCEIPCWREVEGFGRNVVRDPGLCSLGETCVEGSVSAGLAFYCEPAPFSMDLNLLDSCIAHFVEGAQPDLFSDNACSVADRLNTLLDQDSNGVFNIYDVDGCIRTFFGEEPCDPSTGICASGHSFCFEDEECGDGAFCNPDLHRCERECGLIVNRDTSLIEALERPCSGALRVCNADRGRCELAGRCEDDRDCAIGECVEGQCSPLSICQVDRECPTGAYCLMGECRPECYRSLDCPPGEWFCARDNRCQPRPPGEAAQSSGFEPSDYSLQFAQRRVSLDPLNDDYEIPLLIMNRRTQRRVFDEPNAVFGYRLELTYSLKQAGGCLGDLAELSEEQQNECVVSQDEEFLTLDSPFGTVLGTGDTALGVRLNTGIVEALTPGHYEATLRAIFSNGSTTTTTIEFEQPSSSGEYTGRMSAYLGNFDEYPLGTTNVSLRLHVGDSEVTWEDLLQENNIVQDVEFRDLNRGYRISGMLHANESMVFSLPGAFEEGDNEIPLRGIYDERQGRMRLIAVLDVPAEDCASEFGACSFEAGALAIRNGFGRDIRRIIDFIGPFDARRRVFEGIYRETISGLLPFDVTMDGGFILSQATQRVDPLPARFDRPLLAAADSAAVGFPAPAEVLASVQSDIDRYCSGYPGLPRFSQRGGGKRAFVEYMDAFVDSGPVFPVSSLVTFEKRIASALATLGNQSAGALTLTDFFAGKITFCEEGSAPDVGCIDQRALHCGLALHRKALLSTEPEAGEASGWLDLLDVPVKGACDDFDPGASARFQESVERVLSEPGMEQASAQELAERLEAQVTLCDHVLGPVPDCLEASAIACGLREGQGGSALGAGASPSPAPAERALDALELLVLRSGGQGGRNPQPPLPVLFCADGPGVSDDCPVARPVPRTLVTLQEHNRFYRELVQTLTYQAQNGVSDAFYTLYKQAAEGNPFGQGSAHAQKDRALQEAVAHYDAVRAEALSPAASAVLFNWPMAAFASRGDDWLRQLHATNNDRMDALLQLMDLRRRVSASVGAGQRREFMFAQHALQHEFLQQVYLAALQQHWQGGSGAYAGQAAKLLERGDLLLAKVNSTNNAFGLPPDRVYFENGNLQSTNWEAFRDRIETRLGDGTGLEAKVSGAVANLRAAFSDQDTFTSQLLLQDQEIRASVADFCGPPISLPESCSLGAEASELESGCVGPDCLFEFECTSDDCDQVIKVFEQGAARCRLDIPAVAITERGLERPCNRGRVGALLQERASLDLQREQVLARVKSLLRRIAREQAFLEETQSENDALLEYLSEQRDELGAMDAAIAAANFAFTEVRLATEAADCIVIVGTASGTNCLSKATAGKAQLAAAAVRNGVVPVLQSAQSAMLRNKEIELTEAGDRAELRRLRLSLDNLLSEVEPLVSEYQAIALQLFNLDSRVEDTLFQAQEAANRHQEGVEDLVGKLLGRESGSLLTRNRLVQEVESEFQEVLILVHEAIQAFKHHHNLAPEEYLPLEAQALEAVTVQDIRQLLDDLARQDEEICRDRGYTNCDWSNRRFVLRFSLRDELFPGLTDIVDPATGSVLTAGEQFHNLITSSQFTRRRFLGGVGVTEQIELPFNVWAHDRGAAGRSAKRFLLDQQTCDHVLATGSGVAPGTVAVNALGDNLQRGRQFQVRLERGNTDQLRSCVEREGGQGTFPKVNAYTVGFSAVDLNGEPFRSSDSVVACIDDRDLESPNRLDQSTCFGSNFVARDRSLAAPDWKLVIPRVDDNAQGMGWIKGENVEEEVRPIINDIVVYFRYRQIEIDAFR